MTTLRALCDREGEDVRVAAWALFDDAGRLLSQSNDVGDDAPRANRNEAVIAAKAVRLISLKLPPMPGARRLSAARYALEDRLAAPSAELGLAVGPQHQDGTVLAAVCERSFLMALADHHADFERAIPESALSPPRAHWMWCASAVGGGFVRLPDGGAFAVDAPFGDALPPELEAALAQAVKASTPPAKVLVADRVDDAALERWSGSTGVRFERAQPWRWPQAPPEAFSAAPDLLQGEFARTLASTTRGIMRLFRPALLLVAAAIMVHVVATLGQWAWLKADLWRTQRALAALAVELGLSAEGTSSDVATTIAQRYTQMRHTAGLTAPADALPLLARAAPTLTGPAASALRSATYAGGAWTLDLGPLDASTVAVMDRALAGAGVSALHAQTAAGVRFRLTLTP